MLNVSSEELSKRISEIRPQLTALETRRQQIQLKLERKITFMLPDIRRAASRFILDIQGEVPQWIQSYTPTNKINVFTAQQSVERVSSEIVAHVTGKIEQRQNEWIRDELTPLLQAKAEELAESVEGNLTEFYIGIDDLQLKLTGVDVHGPNPPPAWQRVIAGAVGFYVGGADQMLIGFGSGLSPEFFKGIALKTGLILGLLFLELLNPVTLAAVIIGSIWNAIRGNAGGILTKVQQELQVAIVDSLTKSSLDIQENLTEEVTAQFNGIVATVTESLDGDIRTIQDKIREAETSHRQGTAEIERKRALYAHCQQQLMEANQKLDDLLMEF